MSTLQQARAECDRLQATTDYEFSTIVSIVAEKLDVHPGELFDEWAFATDKRADGE